MVANRKDMEIMDINEDDLTLVTKDEDTRKLGSVASDLIQFPTSNYDKDLSGPVIHLYLPDIQEPIALRNVAVVTLGRVDRYSQEKPMIDLSDHHARLLGVSRMHAEIVFHDDKYYIRDKGSTNGTWVNDTMVEPDQQLQLFNGDTLRLGHLMIQVGGVGDV